MNTLITIFAIRYVNRLLTSATEEKLLDVHAVNERTLYLVLQYNHYNR